MHGHLRPGMRSCGRPSLSVEMHIRRAAARRLPSRRAASQRRGSGDHTPGRRCMGDCAGGAVLKKIAARFSFRGLRARKDTIAHATESHGVRRATIAVAQRTGAQRACRVACGVGGDCERERLHSKASWPGSTACPSPDMRRVECLSVCLARGQARRAGGRLAPARARRREARGVTCDT